MTNDELKESLARAGGEGIVPRSSRATPAMPTTARGRARYERILDAAEEMFAERGYYEVAINDVVKKSKGSLATVYKWFGGKDELLYAVIRRRLTNLRESFESFEFSGETLEDDIGALVDVISTTAPLKLIRSGLSFGPFFRSYAKELGPLFSDNLVAPLVRSVDALAARRRVKFQFDSPTIASIIVRFIRGVFIEEAFGFDDDPKWTSAARDVLVRIIVALVRK